MILLILLAAIAQDAGVPPVRDQLNQLLDEACEVHGCADAGVEDGIDHDPGSPPPTAPNPPPDDPTQNEVEAYMSAVNKWAMANVRDAWDKGNP